MGKLIINNTLITEKNEKRANKNMKYKLMIDDNEVAIINKKHIEVEISKGEHIIKIEDKHIKMNPKKINIISSDDVIKLNLSITNKTNYMKFIFIPLSILTLIDIIFYITNTELQISKYGIPILIIYYFIKTKIINKEKNASDSAMINFVLTEEKDEIINEK